MDHCWSCYFFHYCDVKMGTMASQITSLMIVYSSVYSCADQRKHQSSTSLAFVLEIHLGPVNPPHKGPVTRKMFPFDDVIACFSYWCITRIYHLKLHLFDDITDVMISPPNTASKNNHINDLMPCLSLVPLIRCELVRLYGDIELVQYWFG